MHHRDVNSKKCRMTEVIDKPGYADTGPEKLGRAPPTENMRVISLDTEKLATCESMVLPANCPQTQTLFNMHLTAVTCPVSTRMNPTSRRVRWQKRGPGSFSVLARLITYQVRQRTSAGLVAY